MLTPVAVAEPAFTPAVVLDSTSRNRIATVEALVERTIAVPPQKPVVPARVALLAAKKRGQGMVFALVAIAVVCLLGLANAARKHKAELAVQPAVKASAQAPVTVATATSVPQAQPTTIQAPAGKLRHTLKPPRHSIGRRRSYCTNQLRVLRRSQ